MKASLASLVAVLAVAAAAEAGTVRYFAVRRHEERARSHLAAHQGRVTVRRVPVDPGSTRRARPRARRPRKRRPLLRLLSSVLVGAPKWPPHPPTLGSAP